MTDNELRYNYFLDEWIIYAPKRQGRPDRKKDYCPFCKGSDEIGVNINEPIRLCNKFPSLSLNEGFWSKEEDALYKSRSAYGKCEVLVYSAEHSKKFHELNVDEILSIFEKWIEATKQLTKNEKIKYILPFENFGQDVGASIVHPHGQIYAFSFVPHTIQNELKKIKEFIIQEKTCMTCKYLDFEKKTNSRIVFEDQFLIAVVPYSAQYAYDLYIYPKRCYGQLEESTKEELIAFAKLLPRIVKSLSKIFGKEVSYSLSLHQKVFNLSEIPNIYHMYFKLHTPQRNKQSLKILGAVESSLGVFINGTLPEEATKEYKKALNFLS